MSLDLNTTIVTTSPYTINKNSTILFINRNAPSSVILPSLHDDDDGKTFYIKDYSGTSVVNPITITAAGGKKINGVSFAMLNGAYSHLQVAYDGNNWMVIA
jgi:hypothetical protein